ncbi:hypothetical protein [Amycolatopsis sp. WAC 04197]|uniref:hypothetical protein n=1 Tax=Amycolatopsis sp. WAC 04197 TaxID=2203199 RepID=UPI0018F2EC05|nr:hypothetical protein [Amycolatopsis sp. WAC 04197]
MQWEYGDPEPSNKDVRQVTGVSGCVWVRSKPNGLFWYPREGGVIHHWQELLYVDGPAVGESMRISLFDEGQLEAAPRRKRARPAVAPVAVTLEAEQVSLFG